MDDEEPLEIIFESPEAIAQKTPAATNRRRAPPSRLRKAALVTAGVVVAVLALAGIKALIRPLPTREMAWARAREEILKYLAAPETAEFPDQGEIKPFGWGGHSVVTSVDDRDEAGVPIRHQFEVELALNDEQDGLMLWRLKHDGEAVYHNPRIGLGPPLNAADAQRHAEEVRERREAGEWIELAEFTGKRFSGRTKTVTIKERSCRMTWAAFGDMHVEVQNRFGVLIADVGADRPSSQACLVLDLEPNEYCFLVHCDGPWVLVIEE